MSLVARAAATTTTTPPPAIGNYFDKEEMRNAAFDQDGYAALNRFVDSIHARHFPLGTVFNYTMYNNPPLGLLDGSGRGAECCLLGMYPIVERSGDPSHATRPQFYAEFSVLSQHLLAFMQRCNYADAYLHFATHQHNMHGEDSLCELMDPVTHTRYRVNFRPHGLTNIGRHVLFAAQRSDDLARFLAAVLPPPEARARGGGWLWKRLHQHLGRH
jgi:hypothetical protein